MMKKRVKTNTKLLKNQITVKITLKRTWKEVKENILFKKMLANMSHKDKIKDMIVPNLH
jgi:hypothetical protein